VDNGANEGGAEDLDLLDGVLRTGTDGVHGSDRHGSGGSC
jgi:hypothetical protein